MKKVATSIAMLAISTNAMAQGQASVAPSPSTAVAPAAQSEVTLPSNTEVILRMTDDLTTKGGKIEVGHVFRLTVAFDVRAQGVVVIPAGTPATGEVTMRTGKAVFGKSGKMDVELRQIDLYGRRIPVTGKYRQEGEGNTLAAVGAVFLAAGLMFVTGKSAVIPRGRELVAYTLTPEPFPLPAK
jgi:glucose/arabinose dehydrogenase